MRRCDWVSDNNLYHNYHDQEWGRPLCEDQKLFEMLTLECFQAGLSWLTVLKKRENFRRALAAFHIQTVAGFEADKIATLLMDKGIIRNRQKLVAAVTNAKAVLRVQEEVDSFAHYLWAFVDYQVITNHWQVQAEVPAKTELSERISKDMKGRGFVFVGPTIIYSLMQAVGMVNDHIMSCYCHEEVQGLKPSIARPELTQRDV